MRTASHTRGCLSAACIVLLIAGILIAGCTGLPGRLTGPSHEAANNGNLRVYFLDVGQGDSSVVLFHDKVILIDAGEIDQGDRVVADLRDLGVSRIDLLVASHPHSDHIGGMQKVLAAFPVGKVLDTGMPHPSPLYEHFLETVNRENIPYLVSEQGQTIDLDPSLAIRVLSPPKERLDADLNANSIVLKISYGTISFLFTGDAGTAAETALLKTGSPLNAQVLKVAHHGSSDATSEAFLARVRPEVAVISVGKDNPYGHPHKETLDALQAAVPAIYRTDRDGAILVRSDGASYSVTTENGGESIWTSALSTPTLTGNATPAPSVIVTFPTLPPVPSNLTLPVPTVTLPPFQLGNAAGVKIHAVQFNAPGDDRQNLNGEWVQLNNTGDGPVLINGWTLTDRTGSDPYTFPAVILMPGEKVTVYTGNGRMNETSLFMGRTEPLWGNSGDSVFLRDGSGNLIDSR
jgi:beta-lactamase superfamily II metal-dependent hydrolase